MQDLVEKLSTKLEMLSLMLVTAESCTGGMIAAAMTERAGSSAVFERGFVTYSNNAKKELLGVDKDMLAEHGAVSAQVALAMVKGALANSRAEIAVSVTGIAGPSGGSGEKPVGLVYIAYGEKGGTREVHEHHFSGDRVEIRKQTVKYALRHAIEFLERLS